MSDTYLTLKARHQAEINAFPIKFAFNTQQFEEAMKDLGLTPNDTDKVYRLGGGGFIRLFFGHASFRFLGSRSLF